MIKRLANEPKNLSSNKPQSVLMDTINHYISEERALCIFFSEEYNKENVVRLTPKLVAMKDLGLCYTNDPRLPMLMSLARIHSNPSEYHKYPSSLTNGSDL